MSRMNREENIKAIATMWKSLRWTPEQAQESIDRYTESWGEPGMRLRDLCDFNVWSYLTGLEIDNRDRSLDAESVDDYCEKW